MSPVPMAVVSREPLRRVYVEPAGSIERGGMRGAWRTFWQVVTGSGFRARQRRVGAGRMPLNIKKGMVRCAPTVRGPTQHHMLSEQVPPSLTPLSFAMFMSRLMLEGRLLIPFFLPSCPDSEREMGSMFYHVLPYNHHTNTCPCL